MPKPKLTRSAERKGHDGNARRHKHNEGVLPGGVLSSQAVIDREVGGVEDQASAFDERESRVKFWIRKRELGSGKSSEKRSYPELRSTANLLRTSRFEAAHGQLFDRNTGMVEIFAALRGGSATRAQATLNEKRQDRDPIKPPYTTTDGVNKPVLQEQQRAQNGDEPIWSKSTAYAPSR
ncbi:hypothetical protein DFH06DRAFT_1134958 [Mycena polygramma]|nr:hypothetical protein DFH06DRAFT_1134958 [Mycena polygramma]